MVIQRNNILLLIIIFVLSISTCRSNFIDDDLFKQVNNNILEQEFAHDFQAYLSYLSTNIDSKNNIHDFNNIEKVDKNGIKVIDVCSFGAKGDGKTYDNKAFEKAWKEACSSKTPVQFVVPQNKNYLLKQITFSGPCKSSISVQIFGSLEACDKISDYTDRRHWILFDSVQNLVVGGGGTINGNGNVWWPYSCKINKSLPCKDAPTALTFNNCNNLKVKNLKSKDAQQMHIEFESCTNVVASNLMITASKKSPNTDGVHVTNSQNIQISDTTIGTGDDCISIVSGSQKVHATNITCGPGHGISIGSLGSKNSEAHVSHVTVNGAKFIGSENGVRIKTWQGGSGEASNIKFQNVEMQDVENPIIIDQNYCDQVEPCKQQYSAVQVKNVVYENIKGTSATKVAIKFDCSKNFPCEGIIMKNINLVGENGKPSEATCKNVHFNNIEHVSPKCPSVESSEDEALLYNY
ncbi:polygalacturonase-2-like [Solanum stenotomum]|uniref:polygalacturonase-2-like n=1 Tax=Solanum stenotomum TaxID=172797 RepID=UPI0020D090E7|nr:polygalacturonase-2-like [Solanum stenotomum]